MDFQKLQEGVAERLSKLRRKERVLLQAASKDRSSIYVLVKGEDEREIYDAIRGGCEEID